MADLGFKRGDIVTVSDIGSFYFKRRAVVRHVSPAGVAIQFIDPANFTFQPGQLALARDNGTTAAGRERLTGENLFSGDNS